MRALLLLFLMSVIGLANAQVLPQPKREFRGVWIATVTNIDWPSSGKTNSQQQQQELIQILNAHHQTGINAVMFQVRPAADALYAKSREPWSQWLTGKQGKAPNPAYDPLELAITEAHQRGMELHAWFNPYRATFSANQKGLSDDHITKQKPEWFFTYAGRKLFNPGLPEVRDYIIKVILDVVDNYDIDGVHLDDYFYPYHIDGQHIDDAQTFVDHPDGFTDIKDWRRHNVDTLIHALSDSIHHHKNYIKFGISPMGIWANKGQNAEGSETGGGSSYYEQFADSRRWVKEGWLDYINPQIYWAFNNRAAAFEKLIDWWSNNTFGRHLYIGMATYRINERMSASWKDASQMPRQIRYERENPRVQGSVYFSSKSLQNNPLGFTDSLKKDFYRYPALPPAMLWRDAVVPNIPRELTASTMGKNVNLQWQLPLPASDGNTASGYVVYRFDQGEPINLADPKHILNINYTQERSFADQTAEAGKTYQYVVTAVDRLKNESYPSNTATVNIAVNSL
ncbi:MAG: glycoside hydrolase family 10 protein [Janthinobacterium lividum]